MHVEISADPPPRARITSTPGLALAGLAKEAPDAREVVTGAKSELDYNREGRPVMRTSLATHFWDRRSNSVEPLTGRLVALA